MTVTGASRRILIIITALVSLLLSCGLFETTASAGVASGNPSAQYVRLIHDCQAPMPGHAACDAIRVVRSTVATYGSVPEARVALPRTLTVGPSGGYTPAILASAYGYNPAAAAGASQTVAIVDAYQDPNLTSDLNAFDANYGIAEEAGASFRVVSESGGDPTTVPLDTTGWSGEQTLDVEAVRSVCRRCSILMVEANSESSSDLAAAVREAAHLGATEISNSYGDVETDPTNQGFASAYNVPHVVVTASSGDDGWYGWDVANLPYNSADPSANHGDGAADYPAAYTTVIGVGGTQLNVDSSGTRLSESVWNENGPADFNGGAANQPLGAGGSGCSTQTAAPAWQAAIQGYAALGCSAGKRSEVDIAADADPFTGFDTYSTYNYGAGYQNGWATTGGTSLSAPLIAAMWALNGGARGLAYPALALYGHLRSSHATNDITNGGTDACGGMVPEGCAYQWGSASSPNGYFQQLAGCSWTLAGSNVLPNHNQCYAAAGFDGPTGVGTPAGLSTFTPLVPRAAISVPRITHKRAATLTGASSTDPYPAGSVRSWTWNFGDGTTATGVRPRHTWRRAGTYTLTLVVKDNYGATSARKAIRISVR